MSMAARDRFWDVIYQQYHPRLLRQVEKYLPTREESQDVLQDLYVQLRRRDVDPKDVENPPAYLMRMATNLAEAAEKLGVSRNMVEKHLRTALKHCREVLARHEN